MRDPGGPTQTVVRITGVDGTGYRFGQAAGVADVFVSLSSGASTTGS